MSIHKIKGGITAIDGIRATGISAGIKKNGRPDMALIVSDRPCSIAGLFTKNRCPASSITFNKMQIRSLQGQAIIANSGNANAATGARGMEDTKTIAQITAQTLGISKSLVYVASTGVIGEPLPIKTMTASIPKLVSTLSKKGSMAAAEAIMTTDKMVKEAAFVGRIGSGNIRVGGITKGSGMIHPNMATMLAFLTTDVTMHPALLQEALREACD